jgi:hypothetical protein
MFDDTIANWQSLTNLYGEMSDGVLLELDAQLGDLTEMAQQVLRDEMRKRDLSRSRQADNAPKPAQRKAAPYWDDSDDSPTAESKTQKSGLPHEYTWKTLLCECNEREDTYPIWEALNQAGIECWIEGPRSHHSMDTRYPRILVAADQLDRAREIIAQPIPQAIIEECKAEVPEFKAPVCPQCGAEDPLLESAEPVNSWLCEECGKQWTDSPPE